LGTALGTAREEISTGARSGKDRGMPQFSETGFWTGDSTSP